MFNSPRGDLLWVDCFRRWLEIPDQPKLLEKVYQKHQFKSIGIEAVASNRGLFQFAKRLNLNALEMTPKGLDKLAHAQGGIILAEGGGLWRRAVAAGGGCRAGVSSRCGVSELLQFTGTDADEHDDLVDILSYACDTRAKLPSGASGGAPSVWKPSGKMVVR